jgi:UDP:flavonoid glycosyltransferase YjiC (YdhE family)
MQAGTFYRESFGAAQALRRRAVLLIGQSNRDSLPANLPEDIYVAEYLPYSQIMPYACAVVHQGGIGTVAQTLRAGRPMLIVPWAHDQPDNGERIRRIGAGRWLRRDHYRANRAAEAIEPLLSDPSYTQRAQTCSEVIQHEDGPGTACDTIEALLQ